MIPITAFSPVLPAVRPLLAPPAGSSPEVVPQDSVRLGTSEPAPAVALASAAPEASASPAGHAFPHRFIVTVPQGQSREEAQRLLLSHDPQARVTDDLSIINGFAVEVGPRGGAFAAQAQGMTAGLTFTEDRELSVLPEPPYTSPLRMDTAVHELGLGELWLKGFRGQGIGIAVVDTGVAPHTDFQGRIIGFVDMVDHKTEPYDDAGHGTHVSGCAAGSGLKSQGKYMGCAPQADIIGVKVMDSHGKGRMSTIVAGLQWAVQNKEKYHIRVLNLSVGEPASDSWKNDPVSLAIEAVAAAGILPVVAAGNQGPSPYTIANPANAPSALTVGALDDRGTADRSDDIPAKFSSRGPTQIDGLSKPDLLAPGVDITATSRKGKYETHSGTSMASPITAGCAALLFSARPDLTPAEVKQALMQTADPLPRVDVMTQGAGSINPLQAWKVLTRPSAS